MSKYNRDYLKMSDQHYLVYREMVVIPTSVAYGRYWLTSCFTITDFRFPHAI